MNETRKDLKGRKLHNGEIQLADGRYRYKYYDPMGKQHFVYSWRLDQNDPVPAGKRKCEALRQMEKRIEQDSIDHINSSGGNMTVAELVEKVGSRYQLVNLVARRARTLSAQADNEELSGEKKPVSAAIDEVYTGKLSIKH